MKNTWRTLLCMALAFCACRKTDIPTHILLSGRPTAKVTLDQARILHYLRDNLSPDRYRRLDTTTFFIGVYKDGSLMTRMRFIDQPVSSAFVLLHLDSTQAVQWSGLVFLDRPDTTDYYNGKIRIASLGGKEMLSLPLVGGLAYGLPSHGGNRTYSMGGGPAYPLPVMTPMDDGTDTEPVIDLNALTGNEPGGGSPNYEPVKVQGSGPVVGLPVTPESDDYEDYTDPVNLAGMFICFDDMPAGPATYSVTLCTDVPVNADPGASMSIQNFTFGHAFLVVSKTVGATTVTEAFGFYPKSMPVSNGITTPTPSAIKDNGGHEINGSITMKLTADQFATLKGAALGASSYPYQLTTYNCTDYAVAVFNSVRPTNKLTLQRYSLLVPFLGETTSDRITVNSSPQMLYSLLNQMKQAGGAEAGNIKLDLSGATVSPHSFGPC